MKNLILVVGKVLVAWTLLVLLAVWVACGSGGTHAGGAGGTTGGPQLAGSWAITLSDSSYPNSVFNANLVPGACTLTTPVGTYGEDSPYCFAADNTGQGSVSGTGFFFYPPTEVLINTAEVFTPTNSTIGLGLVFVEGDPEDPSGNFAVFAGTGTLTVDGAMSGGWNCAYGPCTVNLGGGASTMLDGTLAGSKQ